MESAKPEEATANRRNQHPKPRKQHNPLQRGINDYLTNHLPAQFYTSHDLSLETLKSSLPKRYTLYPPLLLLPANALSATPEWQAFISALGDDQLQSLYAYIVSSFSSITHIAINAPIARVTAIGTENKMRSPTGLVPVYGDFGPLPTAAETQSDEGTQGQQTKDPIRSSTEEGTDSDFCSALWVRAVQNSGIIQVWAPLYSMFSRGNVTEKARILGEKFNGLDEVALGRPLGDIAAVDMYAGIGYFVFSYLRRGVGRVWAWEINAWSTEGLRRGCEENGWGVRVVKVDSEGGVEGGLEKLLDGLGEEVRVVAFLGDNSFAANVMGMVKAELESQGAWKPICHVNLGLLPSSRQSWEGAVRVLDARTDGWIHVHENVDVHDIDAAKGKISCELESLLCSSRSISRQEAAVACVHVERVKTYAPGVMHCVFDIHVQPTLSIETIEQNKS